MKIIIDTSMISKCIAPLTLIIAFVTLVTTTVYNVQQYKLNRDHNFNSLRPALDIWTNEKLEKGYFKIWHKVHNNGTGVAIIKNYEYSYDNQPIGNIKDQSQLRQNIENIVKCEFTDDSIRPPVINTFSESSTFPPRNAKTLIRIQFPCEKSCMKPKYRSFMDKFNFIFTYESIYKKEFSYNMQEVRGNFAKSPPPEIISVFVCPQDSKNEVENSL